MPYRAYSIFSIFILNLILFNWHSQRGIFSLAIILWALVPLFGLHYIIKQYECFHKNALTMIRSYSAWILFFAWITCIGFSTIIPYALNIISDSNSHYISLYILSPAVTLFIAAITAFIASMMMIIITYLIR